MFVTGLLESTCVEASEGKKIEGKKIRRVAEGRFCHFFHFFVLNFLPASAAQVETPE